MANVEKTNSANPISAKRNIPFSPPDISELEIGFDLNAAKIELYKQGIDPTKEVGDEGIKATTVEFTSDEQKLQEAKFIIVAVPTPVNTDHTPDLTPVIGASEIVGRNLTKGAIVVYESTVYPGCTEDVCIPILERESGLTPCTPLVNIQRCGLAAQSRR